MKSFLLLLSLRQRNLAQKIVVKKVPITTSMESSEEIKANGN